MVDLFLSYNVSKELSVSAGYELTYTDNKDSKDKIGHGVFAMANYNKERVASTFIFFSDPSFKDTYYIGSIDMKVMKDISVYTLGGYTNTKGWYGLVGVRYNTGKISVDTYYLSDGAIVGAVVFPF